MSHTGMYRALLLLSVLSGCATTITSSWKAPDAKPVERGAKVAVLVLAVSPGERRSAEDQLVRLLKNATQAYRIFRDEELKNPEFVRARLQQEGYAYGIVMNVHGVIVESQTTGPSVHHVRMWDDREIWGAPTTSSTKVFVSTRLYSVAQGEMIWSAESQSMNPEKASDLVDEIAKAAADQLAEDGLLPAQ